MSFRLRLVFALMTAALLPMAVVVGVPFLRAGNRARQEAEGRLQLARRQATILVERLEREAVTRTEQAAWELSHDRSSIEAMLVGPEERAMAIARPLSERHGLDLIEIRNAEEALLSSSAPGGSAAPPSGLSEDSTASPLLGAIPVDPRTGEEGVGFFVRRAVRLGGETFSLIGARAIDREAVAGMAEITGGPVELRDGSGHVLQSAGQVVQREAWMTGEVSLDEAGRRIHVAVPPGNVERERRDLLGAFAGVAPFALASALVVGILLAEGISRPIRGLAGRAEEIAAEREGSFSMPRATNEVDRLTDAFDRMLAALAHSEHQRVTAERVAAWQEVARRIAHEVKNPLSPIKIAVENLQRTRVKAPGDFERAFQEETATILEEVESLRRLVDEFSEFARLPRPQPASCDLREILSQALALFSSRIAASGVRVEVETAGAPETVRCDPEQIGRAIKNVLANALEALDPVTERRLWILLRRVSGAREPMAEIDVRDSGVGFEPEALRRVFEPYFTTRPDSGGTGLGMAIVYRIVTDHGGSIEARGKPGEGATITIRIPVEGPSASSRA